MPDALAFIPARATSRRLPGKNLRTVGGVPLVRRAADVALAAERLGLVGKVVVSAENRDAELAVMGIGAFVDWRHETVRRPDARVIDVVQEFLGRFVEPVDPICILLPSSPLRTLRHVVESRLLLTEGVDAVMSVTPFRQDVRGAIYIEANDAVRRLPNEWFAGVNASFFYKHDGHALWCRREWLMKAKDLYDSPRIRAYVIPPEESMDVDTELDLRIAEMLAADAKRACEGLDG